MGKKDGKWTTFDEKGKRIGQYIYKKGRLNGCLKQWYSNGSSSFRIFIEDNPIDMLKRFFLDGRINSIEVFLKNGIQRGLFETWFSGGNLSQTVIIKMGKNETWALISSPKTNLKLFIKMENFMRRVLY
jgi:antitoxin component YwqK of YwqJK toxin-antitoxin module